MAKKDYAAMADGVIKGSRRRRQHCKRNTLYDTVGVCSLWQQQQIK